MIGIFDSGLGGMSVLRAVAQVLPHERMVYAADSRHCPYGSRSREEILQLARRMVDFLLRRGCTTIVAACNTITAAAIAALRTAYPQVQFVGMQPAVKPAAAMSAAKKIAVLATRSTIASSMLRESVAQHGTTTSIQLIVGEGLVEFVEQGMENSPQVVSLLEKLLQPALSAGIDTIVLGCTHYPFLGEAIKKVAPQVTLVDAAMPVALQTKRIVEMQHANFTTDYEKNMTQYEFYTSGNAALLKSMQERHVGLVNVKYGVVDENFCVVQKW